RVIAGERTINLATDSVPSDTTHLRVVLDRLSTDSLDPKRLRDSLEMVFRRGNGRCAVLVEVAEGSRTEQCSVLRVDDRLWQELRFSTSLTCETCGVSYQEPQPQALSFNSPLGACPTCEGFGNVIDIDADLVVPDKAKSIRDGAI